MSGFENFSFTNLTSAVDAAVPAKCEGCAVQCDLKSKLGTLLFEKHMAETIGGTLVGKDGEEFDAMLEANFSEEEAILAKQSARQFIGQGIDAVDDEITATHRQIDTNALSCSGVLKMRAAKDDVRYTVSVCTSARVYIRDSETPQHLLTHIRAESAKK